MEGMCLHYGTPPSTSLVREQSYGLAVIMVTNYVRRSERVTSISYQESSAEKTPKLKPIIWVPIHDMERENVVAYSTGLPEDL
jgi:hypothetical protein